VHSIESFLAFTPRGVGLQCAVTYFVAGEHVYGWYCGANGNETKTSFFMLEHYYSTHTTAFYHTIENDVYGTWVWDFSPVRQRLDRPVPLPEELCHELVRAQAAFSQEWLFYRDDDDAQEEVATYHAMELPLGPINIKTKRLNKFDRSQPTWIYASSNLDRNLIEHLADNWALDYRPEQASTELQS